MDRTDTKGTCPIGWEREMFGETCEALAKASERSAEAERIAALSDLDLINEHTNWDAHNREWFYSQRKNRPDSPPYETRLHSEELHARGLHVLIHPKYYLMWRKAQTDAERTQALADIHAEIERRTEAARPSRGSESKSDFASTSVIAAGLTGSEGDL